MVPEERHYKGLAVAGSCVALGIVIVALALFALPRGGSDAAPLPPTPPATTVVAASSAAPANSNDAGNTKTARRKASAHAAAAGGSDTALDRARRAWEQAFVRNEIAHVPAGWVAGYYDLYARAQKTFGVNWLLLASVHRQETAFSTASSTYHGLNFADCCAGPMQFNVTNGPTSTWERYRDAYRARRPAEGLPPPHEAPPIGLRRLRRDDGRRAACCELRRRGAARRLGLAGRLRLLRPRRSRQSSTPTRLSRARSRGRRRASRSTRAQIRS